MLQAARTGRESPGPAGIEKKKLGHTAPQQAPSPDVETSQRVCWCCTHATTQAVSQCGQSQSPPTALSVAGTPSAQYRQTISAARRGLFLLSPHFGAGFTASSNVRKNCVSIWLRTGRGTTQ